MLRTMIIDIRKMVAFFIVASLWPALPRFNYLVNGTRNQNDICHVMFTKWHYTNDLKLRSKLKINIKHGDTYL